MHRGHLYLASSLLQVSHLKEVKDTSQEGSIFTPDWPTKVPAQKPGPRPSISIFRKSYCKCTLKGERENTNTLDQERWQTKQHKLQGSISKHTHIKTLEMLERKNPHANCRAGNVASLYHFMLWGLVVSVLFSFCITCNVHYIIMLAYNTPIFRQRENNFQGFSLNPERCMPFFHWNKKSMTTLVSQTTSGCQQCKLQCQGIFQAQCVGLINIANKYQ